MLRRRKPPKSGIMRGPQRTWRKHEQWVRGCECIAWAKDAANCLGKIECCHWRSAAEAGTALKPPSWFCYAGCAYHHAKQHRIGQPAFERWLGVDVGTECLKLAHRSPDVEMKAAMKEAGL